MAFVEVLLVVIVLFAVAAVAAGRGGSMGDVPADGWRPELPDELAAEDVERLRFPLAFRGYRMAEVDDVLDRLAEEIRVRDAELDRIRDGELRRRQQVEGTELDRLRGRVGQRRQAVEGMAEQPGGHLAPPSLLASDAGQPPRPVQPVQPVQPSPPTGAAPAPPLAPITSAWHYRLLPGWRWLRRRLPATGRTR